MWWPKPVVFQGTISIWSRGDWIRYFSETSGFVPKPRRSISTALWRNVKLQHRDMFILNLSLVLQNRTLLTSSRVCRPEPVAPSNTLLTKYTAIMLIHGGLLEIRVLSWFGNYVVWTEVNYDLLCNGMKLILMLIPFIAIIPSIL